MDEITLKRGEQKETGFEDDAELWSVFRASQEMGLVSAAKGQQWDAPIDLRVARPMAIDLRKFWALTKRPVPPLLAAALGPNIPVLLVHVVTPFAPDGHSPAKVWGLGYEFVPADDRANTVSVLPTDEVLRIGEVGQKVEVGLQVGGGIGMPAGALEILKEVPAISLTGAKLEASTDTTFQLSLHIEISLRKVVGAPVGAGGALWKMYRQDERLDRPHTLLQTLVVPEGMKQIDCTVRSWAKQAGWLGTGWGARRWSYEDKTFEVSLQGLLP